MELQPRHAEETQMRWRHTRSRRENPSAPWYGWIPVGAAVAVLLVVVDLVGHLTH